MEKLGNQELIVDLSEQLCDPDAQLILKRVKGGWAWIFKDKQLSPTRRTWERAVEDLALVILGYFLEPID